MVVSIKEIKRRMLENCDNCDKEIDCEDCPNNRTAEEVYQDACDEQLHADRDEGKI